MVLIVKKHEFFSIGEFADKSHITLRTLRYYDSIGLLNPTSHNEGGHRLYTRQDFIKLQKILTLKYIGLSLEEIKNSLKFDMNDKDIKKSLEIQKKVLNEKIHHMQLVVSSIDDTLNMVKEGNEFDWDKFINLINVINIDNRWMEQYQNASNLRARINIHEKYSTNKYGWMRWFFNNIYIPKGAKILEIGCGDGTLWSKNIDKIPEGCDIILSDISFGMLKDAESNLKPFKKDFKFNVVNAESIPYEDESMDVIIANHMLYHVDNMDRALSEMKRVLKKDGYFYASTVGNEHMKEMREIVGRFNSELIHSDCFKLTHKFELENGEDYLSKYFRNIEIKRYDDNLLVTHPWPIIDYLFSMPSKIKEDFNEQKLKDMIKYLEEEIKNKKAIFITKDTGFFVGRKINEGR